VARGVEFGVELPAEEEGVAGDFYYFYVDGVGGSGEEGFVFAFEFV
jgi:hypothetical protein